MFGMSQEMTFDSFGFHTNLLKAISELGYEHPTPIQQKAIPLVLAGHDVMGAAQTGTGKTAGRLLDHIEQRNTDRKSVV